MKKKSPPENTKKDFEKVYETPLNWCPLFGYIPSIEETGIEKNNAFYSIIERCLNNIINARYSFFDIEPHTPQKNIRMPQIENLNYPYKFMSESGYAFRKLFKYLDYIALKTSHDWRVLNGHCQPKSNEPLPLNPIGRISNLYDNGTSTTARILKINENLVLESLLSEAGIITGIDMTDIGGRMKIFALYVILESWLIFTSLMCHKRVFRFQMLPPDIQERMYYVEDLYKQADHYESLSSYAEPAYLEITNIALEKDKLKDEKDTLERQRKSYSDLQKEKNKKSREEARKRANLKKEGWAKAAEDICEELYNNGKSRPAYRKNLNYSVVAETIRKRLSCEKKKFHTIRQDAGVKNIVDKWKEKRKDDYP